MTTDIQPGQPVMQLRLPLSLRAFGFLTDFVERVYGTGETTMSAVGDQITISAPADGFGQPVRDPLPPLPHDADEDINVTEMLAAGEHMKWTIESVGQALAMFVESQAQFLDLLHAVN
ncbi:hypothetical protein [Curtobacterium sp. MCBD17_040]|uniref:hypothetical protein n=1 Tax=Curtobacterium sp. MCBD17_040 TaxID=2175674 RepID=UPI000DA9D610|nr:hypothetical protein [Curtobacterium sp. MCBD17_040]WIB65671.1 hypothetical protein DEI94_16250 [Curtobacterium sp. MCBD17_040]